MFHIYINPEGLNGINGIVKKNKAYKNLRSEVEEILKQLKGPNGEDVLARSVKNENSQDLNMDPDRVGDLLVSNHAPFNWSETVSEDGKIFVEPKVTGYKQALIPKDNPSLWTPFIVVGPNIKNSVALREPLQHTDQLPIILKSMGVDNLKYDLPVNPNLNKIFLEKPE
ncbi:MAG: hypothetical protein HRT44_00675 [Bdellovibrionales bacterium]|nr:hypothetical protein [Bdellovibrionales bacterium]NQZ17765.1 hypothetical protein [Bdellovibrionales bacterium]